MAERAMIKPCLINRLVRIGPVLVVFCWIPLWGIIVLAAIGVRPGPNPNPIGPGLLFFVTAWPAIIRLGVEGESRNRLGISCTLFQQSMS